MKQRKMGFWRRGRHYLIDGTFQEVFEVLGKKDNPEDERLWEYDEHGFRTLTNHSFVTHKIQTYIKLIKNPEEWQPFDTENMDKFFDDAIVLFPYERTAAADEKKSGVKERLAPPDRFFRVQQQMIQRRFPWGRNFTPGDADLRDDIETLRYIFSKNFITLILRRRKLALTYVMLGLLTLAISCAALLAPWLVGKFASITSDVIDYAFFGVVCVVSAVVFRGMHGRTAELNAHYRDQYQAAIQASCLLLGRNLQVRQQDIIALIPLIFKEADDDKFNMMNEGRLKKWPEEARKWTKLAFWMAGRVEYNELAMQLHMWRIRRLHFGLQWLATLLTGVLGWGTLVVAALLVVPAFLWLGQFSHPTTFWALYGAAVWVTLGFGLYARSIIHASDNKHRVDLDLIEKNIMTKNIQGHTDVNLHDIVAQRLFIDKSALLYEEDKAKR